MSREQFRRLERGQRLRDWQGRVWSVAAEPRKGDARPHVMIRSGDLVRRVDEHFADDYEVVPDGPRQGAVTHRTA